MSLITRKPQTLIPICCASTLLDLSEDSLRKGCAGTELLTQVRRGNGKRQRISFILEEVIALKTEWIEAARKTNGKVLRLVS
ncbi:MAG: hypothetical protein M3367_15690 [Acidobacteriota bacterium]|nr:hypothetical protein [Acidobacteriota bacterium]